MAPLPLPLAGASEHPTINGYDAYIPASSYLPPWGWVLISLLLFCFVASYILGQCLTWGQPTLTEKECRRRREEEVEQMEKEKEEMEAREWERKQEREKEKVRRGGDRLSGSTLVK